jgi:hypothetical protein
MSWVEEQTWFGLEDSIPFEDTISKDYLLKNNLWECKNKKIIPISEMSTMHLINTINKIKREDWRVYYLQPLQKELTKRFNN